ncbi:Type III restriction enzyme, res subunit family protein [Coccidioides posadasii C735 delta SOWgp]|uniref:Dicer-like protein 1 n=1 Tax=Coccidioides posadasii (strain C735) TaxID=222929 RepID=C5PD40_COCP7|nr:Type III restriction enzyme, res subunit family protein [Coccidioides posadasii C735 delta SOWgp]EER25001.1 Type III restriction enzyme, res subunit family protein [Coccidioides posadasii C735 delta SOWgp]|eukprot:XP_003067146.1 Type III restriction enzyme, res subunit family protein [Coccidioides posadasii C735 delta SOWgp]
MEEPHRINDEPNDSVVPDPAGPSELAESDSEDEHTHPNNADEPSIRRKQNLRFKELLSARAEEITAEDIKEVIKATKDDELSMSNLLAKQDFASVIHDPREYQLELFEKAKKDNIIAVLDTGSGKTLIAVLLLKHIIEQELIDRSAEKPHRVSFFLVDSVTLVFQQAAVLQNNINQRVDKFCGAMETDLWNGETWERHLAKNMVIVCTAEVLYQCLLHAFVKMENINLLIFDEAHNAKKDHPYARIVKDFYLKDGNAKRPKIFGMTASPVDAKVDVVKAARNLETLLNSQIATASNLSLLRQSVARPNEEVWSYDRLDQPFETRLYKELRSRFGDLRALEKLFTFSLKASSNLGAWCADWVWSYALTEESLPKLEGRAARTAMGNLPIAKIVRPEAEIQRIREASEIIRSHKFGDPAIRPELLSPKVRRLHHELLKYFERHTDTKCIVFTEQRHTARILCDLFSKIGTKHLRPGVLIGVRSDASGGMNISFRQQVLAVVSFRKGEVNCLFATSVAEEGLDIPDCNLIVRFDLASTLTQYIQSRGRARHMNSTTCLIITCKSQEIMKRFCISLPKDRILNSNDVDALYEGDRNRKCYTVQTTGAKLTYNSSLVVLAHFANSLQYEKETSTVVSYYHRFTKNAFVCEVVLPEKSPIRGIVGKPASKKLIAKQSAAFETCLLLRKHGLLDDHFVSTYHKRLPAMRNARLAISSKKSNQYDMKVKPKLWETSRGIIPTSLNIVVLGFRSRRLLHREYHPLVLLTREKLPHFPEFPLYLEDDIECDVICSSIISGFQVSGHDLEVLTTFTLRIFQDIFHKVYDRDVGMMTYWLAPLNLSCDISSSASRDLLDWGILQFVFDNPEIPWSSSNSAAFFANRFVYDRWNGRYRYFTHGIDPSLRPSDPPPSSMARRRHMGNIMDYCLSLFKNARKKFLENCDWTQPVIKAEIIQLRRNLLDKRTNKEKIKEGDYYICLEPLTISAIPASVAAFAFAFPAIISRIESYLIALEACQELDLPISPELALEALTKDSDNTDEHRAQQIHFQRGMGKNYERLEFLGDCFLKMATSISLFAMNPDNDEYDFHVKRMCLVCNQNLFKTAVRFKLYEFIRSQSFSRRGWYPEGLTLLQGKGQSKGATENKHALADKTIADVCEALIGACCLLASKNHRFDIAVKAVTALVSSDDHNVLNWEQYSRLYSLPKYQTAVVDAAELDLAAQVKKKLGYVFKYPKLLRSAFTHPSYPSAWARVPCYQRLEFLGDALLDMACVEHIYHKHPDKDPQWLTEHKMAMVSNKFLGSVAVRLGLHSHLNHFSTSLQSQITNYVEEIEAAELESGDSPDAWTLTSDPPKCLPDMVEAYIGAIFIDSNFSFEVVEEFFQKFLKKHFEDMTIYDTYANKHPTTYLHNRLAIDFGCSNYCLKAGEVPYVDGPGTRVLAAVIVHDEVVTEGVASSSRYAKLKASEAALSKLEGLPPFRFREIYGCNCQAGQSEAGNE